MKDLEAIRLTYLPHTGIRVLLLGESLPPQAKAQRFFYLGNSTLFRASVGVFAAECTYPREPEAFLRCFMEDGWFLGDFFSTPGLKPSSATPEEYDSAVTRIGELIDEHHPEVVAGVLHGLEDMIRTAVEASAVPMTSWRTMRFPHWRSASARDDFQRDLRSLIHDVGCAAEDVTPC